MAHQTKWYQLSSKTEIAAVTYLHSPHPLLIVYNFMSDFDCLSSLPCTTPEPCSWTHSDVNWHFRSLVNIINIAGKQGTLMPEAWHRVRFSQMFSLNYTS